MRLVALLLPIVGGCGTDNEAPLTASEVSILAPLPGQDTAVAYLTLRNRSPGTLAITQVSSPEFATVEMHATIFADGTAEMLLIDSLTVAGNSDVEFATGGRHLMLLGPQRPLAPGDPVALEFHYGRGQPLTVRAPLQQR